MNWRELRDIANKWASRGESASPEVGSKVLEYIDASHLFPNAKDGVNTLVAWQQSDTPDRVYLGFAKDKDSLPEYITIYYAAERFYNDPYGTMVGFLSITHDAVQDIDRISKNL